MQADPDPPLDLAEQLYALLRANPSGSSEYQLIQALKARHCVHLPNAPLSDELNLFRTHFLVFNALYRLRERLWQEQLAHLSIDPLCIRLHDFIAAEAALAERDPLRDYYLDLDNLRDTRAQDVQRLLDDFWTRLRGGDEKRAALQLFELDDTPPVDLARLKRRYRQLASQHHPDRGGDTERLQSINLAMEILQRYYK